MLLRGMLVLSVAAAAGAPLSAGGWVEFGDGRVLRVDSVQREGSAVTLELEGGGTLLVPAERIVASGSLPTPEPPATAASRPAAAAAEPWRGSAGEFADLIADAASRHGLEPALLASIARVESNFDPYAVSHKGACGMLQLMPETAERFGVDNVFDVEQNVDGGAKYLKWLLGRYHGDTKLALAAYNAGEGAVDRHRGVPPYRETRNYVKKVLRGPGMVGPR